MSADDLIQIVDDQDTPLTIMPLSQAYQLGKIHRMSRIMLEDKDGNILLQKRDIAVKRWPGAWDNSAAGHVDAGEDYLTAAMREMSEEIGLEDIELQQIGNYYSEFILFGETVRRFNRVYKAVIDKTPDHLGAGEVSAVKWFKIDEIKNLIKQHPDQVTNGLVEVIEKYY